MPESLFDDILRPKKQPPERTWPITVVCIAYLVLLAVTIGQILTHRNYPPKIILLAIVPIGLFVAWMVFGLWRMKKWAALLFIVLFSLAATRRLLSRTDIFASVFAVTAVVTVATQWKKMN